MLSSATSPWRGLAAAIGEDGAMAKKQKAGGDGGELTAGRRPAAMGPRGRAVAWAAAHCALRLADCGCAASPKREETGHGSRGFAR